jgi:hypothetical protein
MVARLRRWRKSVVAGQVKVCGATPKGVCVCVCVCVWRVLEVTGPRFPRLLQGGLIYELAHTRMARGSTRWIRRWREEERSQEMYQ